MYEPLTNNGDVDIELSAKDDEHNISVNNGKLLTKSSLRLVNVGPQDVHNGYVKCILGLLWSCVQTYQLETVNKPSSINNKSKKTEQVISPEQTCMSHIYFIAYHAKFIKK